MRRAAGLVVAVLIVACQSTASPSALPSASLAPPVLGVDWGRAASLDRPENYMESVPPDYISNHPILRIAGQATMSDVVAGGTGRIVSVGYAPPDWVPIAWTSDDAGHWAIHSMDGSTGTFPVAIAAGADGSFVAVGRTGRRPAVWTSPDGATWTGRTVPILGTDGTAERITSVVATGSGYVAGGSVGPELGDRRARFWRSADGSTWVPVADDAPAFSNAEVRSIASVQGRFVAVGVVGDAEHPTGAVAWTSADGSAWTRTDDPSFVGAVAVSVVAAPFGGLVAVGSTVDRAMAVAWHSADGRTWTRAPSNPGLEDPGFVWMTDAAAIADEVIAVGDYQPNQRGTAVSWVTPDGMTWQRAAPAPVQEGAEFYAIATGGPGAVAVGAYGLPDSFVPNVWLTPAH